MKPFNNLIKIGLIIMLIISSSVVGLSQNPQPATAPEAKATTVVASLTLLPDSDVIAVIDVARVVNEVLPQLRTIAPQEAARLEKSVSDIVGLTGIDPYRIKSAVIGFKMAESNSISAIIDGISFDPNSLSAIIKSKNTKQEIKSVEHKGKQIFVVTSEQLEKSRVVEELAFTQFDAERVVLGNLNGVKSILDGGNSTANASLQSLLRESNNGLIRFAANMPASAKQTLTSQGDLFAQFATIKTIWGGLDLTGELNLLLDAKLRTGSNEEATKLQNSLTGLVGLGKMFLSGNDDPLIQALVQVFDLIKLGAQRTDVSLSLSIPKSVFDQIAAANKKKAEKQ